MTISRDVYTRLYWKYEKKINSKFQTNEYSTSIYKYATLSFI